jgi:hypothetical protein
VGSLEITDHAYALDDGSIVYSGPAAERKLEQIEAEALLDGIYVLRADLELEALDATSTVSALKAWQTSSAPFAASRRSG